MYAHGWIQSEGGARFSKSAGNAADPLEIGRQLREAAGEGLRVHLIHEPLRYFLLREVPMGRDGDFSWDLFVERYNADLANELGNLLNRALSMTQRYFQGVLDAPGPAEAADEDVARVAGEVIARYREAFAGWQISVAMGETWRLVKRANQYVQETEPWTLAKDDAARPRLARVLATLLEALRVTAALLAPAMPRTAQAIGDDLGLAWPSQDALQGLAWRSEPATRGRPLAQPVVLFPRIVAEKPARA